MKLQLDTKEKVIRLEESINLGEFVDAIEQIFPNKVWREYRLETNCTIQWINPVTVPIYPYTPYTNPYPYPWITYDCTGVGTLADGVYNIEV